MNDRASIAIVHALSAVPRGQHTRAGELAKRTGFALDTIRTYIWDIRDEYGDCVIESARGRGYRVGVWPRDEVVA